MPPQYDYFNKQQQQLGMPKMDQSAGAGGVPQLDTKMDMGGVKPQPTSPPQVQPQAGGAAPNSAEWSHQNINSNIPIEQWQAWEKEKMAGCPPTHPYRGRAGQCAETPDNCPEGQQVVGNDADGTAKCVGGGGGGAGGAGGAGGRGGPGGGAGGGGAQYDPKKYADIRKSVAEGAPGSYQAGADASRGFADWMGQVQGTGQFQDYGLGQRYQDILGQNVQGYAAGAGGMNQVAGQIQAERDRINRTISDPSARAHALANLESQGLQQAQQNQQGLFSQAFGGLGNLAQQRNQFTLGQQGLGADLYKQGTAEREFADQSAQGLYGTQLGAAGQLAGFGTQENIAQWNNATELARQRMQDQNALALQGGQLGFNYAQLGQQGGQFQQSLLEQQQARDQAAEWNRYQFGNVSAEQAAQNALQQRQIDAQKKGSLFSSLLGAAGTIGSAFLSDMRTKKEVEPFKHGMDVVKEINPISYRYNERAGKDLEDVPAISYSAQVVEKVFPEAIHRKRIKNVKNARLVDLAAMQAVTINALKELDQRIGKIEEEE